MRGLVVGLSLLCLTPSVAWAQVYEFTGPVAAGSKVLYEVARTADATATPIIYLDGRPYPAVSFTCVAVSCEALPPPDWFVAASTPETHLLDLSLRNAAGESLKASAILVQPTPPATIPAIGPCPYRNPQGVLVPKNPGDLSVHGYNPLDFSSVAARQGHADRVAQLKSWGFSVREFPDFARNRILMLTVCHGVIQ